LLALAGAHHFVHVSRIGVKTLNGELNPNRHLLALAGTHHFVDVSRIRVNPLNTELNPIRHLLALAGDHHFVDVSRIRVNHNTHTCLYLYSSMFQKLVSEIINAMNLRQLIPSSHIRFNTVNILGNW
jgi:hypothetical protein